MININSSYLEKVFDVDLFPTTVVKSVEIIKRIKKDFNFEAIAFTGMSGAAVAFPVSAILKIPLLCVRKSDDSSHHCKISSNLEGATKANSYVIIDDFIETGKTIDSIIDSIAEENTLAACKAILLYRSADGISRFYPANNSKLIPVYRC